MDEPMEQAGDESQTVNPSDMKKEINRKQQTSVLRLGGMVMMTLTEEDYMMEYWPRIEGAVRQLLELRPDTVVHISYEQMYSCVYKCVCKQFSERLYRDLITYISVYLQGINSDLRQNMSDFRVYIQQFATVMKQYLHALGGIVPIFNYMNRFYVATKLKTDLDVELRRLFKSQVVDPHSSTLLSVLEEASQQPFSVPPPVMSSVICNLHQLSTEFAHQKPSLFARYVPNVLPKSRPEDLADYIQEVQEMKSTLCEDPEFHSCDRSLKRPNDDEAPKVVPLVCVPRNSSDVL